MRNKIGDVFLLVAIREQLGKLEKQEDIAAEWEKYVLICLNGGVEKFCRDVKRSGLSVANKRLYLMAMAVAQLIVDVLYEEGEFCFSVFAICHECGLDCETCMFCDVRGDDPVCMFSDRSRIDAFRMGMEDYYRMYNGG
jgi:hypothetical protein